MALTRGETAALALAAVVALAMPTLLLARASGVDPVQPALSPALALGAPPVPTTLFTRTLFAGTGAPEATAVAEGAPALIGIVGRIGRDAVAMVRDSDGKSRTLAVGESVDGWRLESLAIDAAFFTRGGEQARVPLPAG